MHDALTLGLTLVAILVGILLNRADFRRLEDKMDRRFDAIDAELRFFHNRDGQHEARLNLMEKR